MIEIRDLRGGDWCWAPNDLILDTRLGALAKMVYMALAMHANTHQEAYPSKQRIGEITGLSTRTVRYQMVELEKAGYIQIIERKGKPNSYVLLRITRAEYAPLERPVQNKAGTRADYDTDPCSSPIIEQSKKQSLLTIRSKKIKKTVDNPVDNSPVLVKSVLDQKWTKFKKLGYWNRGLDK